MTLDWFRRAYGDPCRECGYGFSTHPDRARLFIAEAPDRYGELLESPAAMRKPGPDVWSPSAYTWHVSDALRIWAERFWVLGQEAAFPIVPFDQERLAEVRGYDRLSPPGAVWALRRAVDDLESALEGIDLGLSFDHPEYGPLAAGDTLVYLAHEIVHHEMDVRRGLER